LVSWFALAHTPNSMVGKILSKNRSSTSGLEYNQYVKLAILRSVKHILVDCTRYSAARQRYFGVDTLKEVFENVASRNIIAYVKDTGFYNRI